MTVVEKVKEAVGLTGGHHDAPSTRMEHLRVDCQARGLTTWTAATREQMSAAKLPLAYRDSCANLLIPLNRCRFETYYMPWKCEVGACSWLCKLRFLRLTPGQQERHSYEKCQYEEFKLRVKKMDELRAERDGARSN